MNVAPAQPRDIQVPFPKKSSPVPKRDALPTAASLSSPAPGNNSGGNYESAYNYGVARDPFHDAHDDFEVLRHSMPAAKPVFNFENDLFAGERFRESYLQEWDGAASYAGTKMTPRVVFVVALAGQFVTLMMASIGLNRVDTLIVLALIIGWTVEIFGIISAGCCFNTRFLFHYGAASLFNFVFFALYWMLSTCPSQACETPSSCAPMMPDNQRNVDGCCKKFCTVNTFFKQPPLFLAIFSFISFISARVIWQDHERVVRRWLIDKYDPLNYLEDDEDAERLSLLARNTGANGALGTHMEPGYRHVGSVHSSPLQVIGDPSTQTGATGTAAGLHFASSIPMSPNTSPGSRGNASVSSYASTHVVDLVSSAPQSVDIPSKNDAIFTSETQFTADGMT